MPRLLTDPTVPQWCRDMGFKEQADADSHFDRNVLPQWKARKATWISNAQMNVDRDLPVVPWNDPPPQRLQFVVDDSAPVLLQIWAPPDPNLTAPVLPLKTPSHPSEFFVAGAAPMDGTAAVLKEIARLRADMGLKP